MAVERGAMTNNVEPAGSAAVSSPRNERSRGTFLLSRIGHIGFA